WQHDQALDAIRDQFVDNVAQRRIADLHAKSDGRFRHRRLQKFRLALSPMQQRRAGDRIPNALVFGYRLLWPPWQNDAVQNEPPQPARRFDDARIGEELTQINAKSGRARSVGRAELNEQ